MASPDWLNDVCCKRSGQLEMSPACSWMHPISQLAWHVRGVAVAIPGYPCYRHVLGVLSISVVPLPVTAQVLVYVRLPHRLGRREMRSRCSCCAHTCLLSRHHTPLSFLVRCLPSPSTPVSVTSTRMPSFSTDTEWLHCLQWRHSSCSRLGSYRVLSSVHFR